MDAPSQRPLAGRYLLLFLGIQAVLFTLTLIEPVRGALIVPLTEILATVSAALMTAFDPSVVTHGVIIQNRNSGFAVEISAGCNGVEPMIMLAAAILAFPAPLRPKLCGIAIGFIAIQLVNTARIITLYYIGQWNSSVFEWAHLYLWPAMIMVDALVVWLLWLRHLQRSPHEATT